MAKNSLRIWENRIVTLHKDGLGLKKNSNAQGHTAVFQQGFHSEQASPGVTKEVKS